MGETSPGHKAQILITSASRSLELARLALIPSSTVTLSGDNLCIPEFNFLAHIIPQPDRPATRTGDIMTDQTSVTVRFITESNAMETVMDMVEPIPDSMNQATHPFLSRLMEKAWMRFVRMYKALSMIEAFTGA